MAALFEATSAEIAISPANGRLREPLQGESEGKDNTSVVWSFLRNRRFSERMAAFPVNRTFTRPGIRTARRARRTKRASASALNPLILFSRMITAATLFPFHKSEREGWDFCPPAIPHRYFSASVDEFFSVSGRSLGLSAEKDSGLFGSASRSICSSATRVLCSS